MAWAGRGSYGGRGGDARCRRLDFVAIADSPVSLVLVEAVVAICELAHVALVYGRGYGAVCVRRLLGATETTD